MTIQKVDGNRSGLSNGLDCAVAGGLAGYALQYALPLTAQEKDKEYYAVIRNIKSHAVNAKHDVFEMVTKGTIQKETAFNYLDSIYQGFISDSIKRYNLQIKKARGSSPFIIAGAVTGLLFSFIHNVVRKDAD